MLSLIHPFVSSVFARLLPRSVSSFLPSFSRLQSNTSKTGRSPLRRGRFQLVVQESEDGRRRAVRRHFVHRVPCKNSINLNYFSFLSFNSATTVGRPTEQLEKNLMTVPISARSTFDPITPVPIRLLAIIPVIVIHVSTAPFGQVWQQQPESYRSFDE